ncbi:protein GLUTAMINE DUMPER 2-like [Typha angustifolia]|uniref:protein GLUTAMINE DUMPER 2-like n=1 Tax=Typha angustifolia TaxID=59011 RepID=UPI003C2F8FB9
MRPGAEFSTSPSSTSEPATVGSHSTWHSPVPYLFGGLAAMLGLIAFALLVLACSYWKLSGYLESGGAGDEADADADGRDAEKPAACAKPAPSFVIMAGDVKPSYLATPICSRASSFADKAKDGDERLDEEKAIDGGVTAPLGDQTPIQGV